MVWARSLSLYLLDFPLALLYAWIEDLPGVRYDTIFVVSTPFVAGSVLYAGLGWLAGRIAASRRPLR